MRKLECRLSEGSRGMQADDCRCFLGVWLQQPVSALPVSPHKVSTRFLFFFVPTSLFYPHSFCYFTFFVFCFTVSVPLTLSPSVLNSLHFNVEHYPSFFYFRLWFWWHVPRVAVIAECRLGRWDVGRPSAQHFHSLFSVPLHSFLAYVCASFVFKTFLVLEVKQTNKKRLTGTKYSIISEI